MLSFFADAPNELNPGVDRLVFEENLVPRLGIEAQDLPDVVDRSWSAPSLSQRLIWCLRGQ